MTLGQPSASDVSMAQEMLLIAANKMSAG